MPRASLMVINVRQQPLFSMVETSENSALHDKPPLKRKNRSLEREQALSLSGSIIRPDKVRASSTKFTHSHSLANHV